MVILYTTHCPQCKILATRLEQKGVDYEAIDDIEVMLEKGFRNAPMLEVDGEAMTCQKAFEWLERI